MSDRSAQAIVEAPPFTRSYSARFIELSHGKGSYLWDSAGRRYLDFGSGIAVNSLGHGRSDIARIAAKQMRRLIHVSNLYTTRTSVALAQRLVGLGEFAAVHFGNSGTEANEGALKFARLYGKRTAGDQKSKFLCFENGFHGRTLGALSVTPSAKYQQPFGPLVPGVTVLPLNDPTELVELDSGEYCAVIVEPLQGEGGLQKILPEFAEALNESCTRTDTLLIADEVQTGLGRCGAPLASPTVGLHPDIVTLAKPLAAGLPLSATLIPKRVDELISAGEHGTTFGGGPVTTSVALKVTDTLLDQSFLDSVKQRSDLLSARLQELCDEFESLTEVRGLGMLRGLEVAADKVEGIAEVVSQAEAEGLLLLRSGSSVIRVAPPLVIKESEIDEGVAILRRVIANAIG